MSTPIKATFDKPEHVIIPNQIMLYDDVTQKFILVDKPINLKRE